MTLYVGMLVAVACMCCLVAGAVTGFLGIARGLVALAVLWIAAFLVLLQIGMLPWQSVPEGTLAALKRHAARSERIRTMTNGIMADGKVTVAEWLGVRSEILPVLIEEKVQEDRDQLK